MAMATYHYWRKKKIRLESPVNNLKIIVSFKTSTGAQTSTKQHRNWAKFDQFFFKRFGHRLGGAEDTISFFYWPYFQATGAYSQLNKNAHSKTQEKDSTVQGPVKRASREMRDVQHMRSENTQPDASSK